MILDIIIKDKKKRLEEVNLSVEELKKECLKAPKPKDFYSALRYGKISIIGEVKKASPSKGVIREHFVPTEIASEYEGSVEAISVLTEEDHFQGHINYLREISSLVDTPTLCKDFIFTEEQVYLARSCGASAILLIARILDDQLLSRLLSLSRELGMEPLVETHTKEEITRVLGLGAKIIGINNRDLATFNVDINRSIDLSRGLPKDVVVVAESGIKDRADIKILEENGINAVLIGETFVRSDAPMIETARDFRGKTTEVKVCGITTETEVNYLNKIKPEYVGFVFAKSKREVTSEVAKTLGKKLHPSIKKVGVFVDSTFDEVMEIATTSNLDIIQLHGNETTELCEKLRALNKFKVWKALSGEKAELSNIAEYSKYTDLLLFDSSNPGGGETFDWDKVKELNNIILAGGLNIDNVGEAIHTVNPTIVDVSSGVESTIDNIRGKDYKKILAFVEEVRKNG